MAEWKTPNLGEKLNDKQLYVASDETWLHITNDRLAEGSGLQSNQEKADRRIFVNAAHAAAEGYPAVVVTADDTDVCFCALLAQPLYHVRCSKNAEQRIGLGTLTSTSYATAW